MDCPNCQEPLREGAQFCTHCGARTTRADASVPTAGGAAGVAETPRGGDGWLVGRVLDGKYEVVAPLGSGGMGAVYRARRVLIGDEVAVKVLHTKFVDDEKLVERFRREARAAAQLHHPNVVTIHDYGESRGPEGFAYIVMELVRGESLRELLRREGRLEPRRAVSLMRDVCAGVGAAHRRGIIHRDIKPDNIIVTPADEDDPSERVKVVDFGIAKLRDMAADGSTLTEAGMMVGTLSYMSPEQCQGEPLDARADVYSLGAMLHEMLSGAPPFAAPSMTGLIIKHVTQPPPPLPADVQVPEALRAAVLRALAKDPDERPRDASEFAREIQSAFSSSPAVESSQPSVVSTQPDEPFFPATARPVPVTPTHPPQPNTTPDSTPDSTLPPAAAQDEVTVVHEDTAARAPSPAAPRAPAPQPAHARAPHAPQPPYAQLPRPHAAAPPRRSRKGYVVGLLVVLLVGLGSLTLLGLFLYMNRGPRRTANVNARPTPTATPTFATPTPYALSDAMQRAEQRILAGALVPPADLTGMTAAQLRLLRNTVPARYGRAFREDDLRQYFQSRPWYKPRTDYDDDRLTTNDLANADLLKAFEENNGAPPLADVAEVGKEVGDALKEWADSTRERDIEAHMSSYADTLETYYKKQNVPAAQVRADRQEAFVRYDRMDVKLGNVKVVPDPTGTRATVTLDKTWEFDSPDKNTKGSVRQQLTLVRAGGHWLINGEKDLQVYYTNSEEY